MNAEEETSHMQTVEIVVTGPHPDGIYIAVAKETIKSRELQRVLPAIKKGHGLTPWQAIHNLSKKKMSSER